MPKPFPILGDFLDFYAKKLPEPTMGLSTKSVYKSKN
jgi:hypothetical protein